MEDAWNERFPVRLESDVVSIVEGSRDEILKQKVEKLLRIALGAEFEKWQLFDEQRYSLRDQVAFLGVDDVVRFSKVVADLNVILEETQSAKFAMALFFK